MTKIISDLALPVVPLLNSIYQFLNFPVKVKMIVTDKIAVENGIDFSFVCRKIPFAITCSTDFLGYGSNLIDMDLVNKMQIPIRNIKVKRMQIQGQNVRSVGIIKQSLQCVVNGKSVGTVHITAKVIRDLFSLFNVDCLASENTYTKLTGKDPPSSDDDDDEEVNDPVNIPSLGSDSSESDVDDPGDDQDQVDNNEKPDVVDAVLSYLTTINQPAFQSPSLIRSTTAQPQVSQNYDNDQLSSMTKPPRPQTHRDHQDEMCKLCYMENLPPEIFLSHPNLHPSCPSISDADKKRMYGSNWRSLI